MITRPLVFVIVCFGLFILIQSFVPKVMALKRSNVGEYMLEDQRTRKRKNYVMRLDRDSDLLDKTGNRLKYDLDSLQPDPSNPEELSAFIVDYANMIRNDVILLDNSVETRTRKRGNIKVEKYNHALPDPPCSCEYSREIRDFGENSYPRYVETRSCDTTREQKCHEPYVCKENIYNVTIIRRRDLRESFKPDSMELPNDLKYKWIAESRPISVGCLCTSEYYIQN